ncbi:viral A-type inclusion protein, partial [Reticulomyxa filosa]
MQSQKDTWQELLTESWKEWFVEDDFKESSPDQCYHRKILWMLRYLQFETLPDVMKEEVHLKSNLFLLDNECWNDQDRHDCIEYINATCTGLSAWEWFFSLIIKIPLEDANDIEEILVQESNFDDNYEEDEKKIESLSFQMDDKTDELLAKQFDYLKYELKYCIACIPWKDLMDKQIKSLEQLRNFIKKTFGNLYDITKKNELNYSLYQFIKTDRNEEEIKSYYGPFMNLQLWTSALEEFDQFEILQQNFLTVSKAYNMNLSYETEIFYHGLKKWEYCTLANIYKANGQILQLLKRFAKELQLMVDRKDSIIFHNLWNEYVKESESAVTQNSMLAGYPHKMSKRKSSIYKDIVEHVSFEAYMNVFESANQTWEHLSKAIKDNTLQFADMRWFENVNWKLEMDILIPEMKEEKVDKVLQSKIEQTEKASRLEAANKGWTALKQATQTIQKNHKEKSNIKQDRTWQDFEEKLA